VKSGKGQQGLINQKNKNWVEKKGRKMGGSGGYGWGQIRINPIEPPFIGKRIAQRKKNKGTEKKSEEGLKECREIF